MPFGSEWVRDPAYRVHVFRKLAGSPMPFGSEWVRDKSAKRWKGGKDERPSPMPFGSEWVRDVQGANPSGKGNCVVSNAFRQ